jgi:hypothetical protein
VGVRYALLDDWKAVPDRDYGGDLPPGRLPDLHAVAAIKGVGRAIKHISQIGEGVFGVGYGWLHR